MSGPKDLSVIVVTHGRAALAVATLESARTAAAGLDVQWLVIDSGSRDGTPERIEHRFPDIRVERCQNIGFAAANNRAFALATGRFLLLLNPDVEVVSGRFAALIDALEARPTVGIASVIQRSADAELQFSIRRFPSPRRALGEALCLRGPNWCEEDVAREHYDRERTVDWLCGAFLIARAETVREIGGLDERFFLYSEETDWCYRAQAAGWEVRHLPQMVVTHHTTVTARPDLVAQLSYAKVLFASKHYPRTSEVAIRAALVARHIVRILGFGARALRRPRARARLEAERHALAVVSGVAPPPFA